MLGTSLARYAALLEVREVELDLVVLEVVLDLVLVLRRDVRRELLPVPPVYLPPSSD
jgi:hypothetical protein